MEVTKLREKILSEVHTILSQYLCFSGVEFYLFGSWARGEERASSDIDIAVSYKQELMPGTLVELREAFEESTIPYHVEIVDLNKSDKSFRDKVLKEGILWSDYSNELSHQKKR